ncbi:MAG: 30S ribosomal protein S7 [Candidatus Obscuribacterales bacterium]|jgi:small subunit ribosomal protein S7|nr:30S ribosomal protein S7 [Candidatus Obscuribacterales bacterium]
MSRRVQAEKRIPPADAVHNSQLVSRFVHKMMERGKKSTAQRTFYDALALVKERSKQEPIELFNKAVKNVTPLVEVKARRVGGSTYQVPVEVKQHRGTALATQWIINNSRKRAGRSFAERLSAELIDASNGTGASVKKRDETHKMAEANKAFAHYRY